MLKIENLKKTYDRRTRNANTVLHGISLSLPDTGFVCILGPSGCGKTSLLNAIGGLDRFDSGSIICDGKDLKRCGSREMESERNASFGYIFQNYHLLSDHSVMYNVYLGMHSLDLTHEQKVKRVKEVLQTVGMELYTRRTVGELSGGQQQRVAIARALARRPRVIFADEPTGNLDEENTINICKLLRSISKTSLVIMVTHEERIASLFADRIITLADGKIVSDAQITDRGSITGDSSKRIYAGEYTEESISTEKLGIRLLYDKDTAPEQLTIVIRNDKVIIKHDGGRLLTCTEKSTDPVVIEGHAPRIKIDDEHESKLELSEVPLTRAGRGIGGGMIFREAKHLLDHAGTKSGALRLFLVLLAALTVFTVSDMLTVAYLDPQDFVTCDSHLLLVSVDRGAGMTNTEYSALTDAAKELRTYLSSADPNVEYIPFLTALPVYRDVNFAQLNSVSMHINNINYLPLSKLDGSTLVYGRLPESTEEVVIDKWVLETLMKKDGILQNGISDIRQFIGKHIFFSGPGFNPEIVGICDMGEPSAYFSYFGLCSVDSRGENMIPLSELKSLLPEKYGNTVIENDQCIVIEDNAGEVWGSRIGREYKATSGASFTIYDSYPSDVPFSACIAVNDDMEHFVLESLLERKFYVYTENMEETIKLINSMPEELSNKIVVTLTDRAGAEWDEQLEAVSERIGARTIVTVSVITVCAVMLWLLQRSRIRARTGMIAVYRMLCIPSRKLVSVFITESLVLSLTSALPAALITFLGMKGAALIPELGYSVQISVSAFAITYFALLAFHLLASVIPLLSLLRIPPAGLAAKYDF